MPSFVDNLNYPSNAEFPYPFHDTGIDVTAMVYDGNPWDLDGVDDEPYEVKGMLFIRPAPYTKFMCSVLTEDGRQHDVDPETVKRVEK